jgi:hypothetical protein
MVRFAVCEPVDSPRIEAAAAAVRPLVLVRLAYLAVSNAFATLRLLPMSDQDKDIEILSLRHQVSVLQRQPTAQGL